MALKGFGLWTALKIFGFLYGVREFFVQRLWKVQYNQCGQKCSAAKKYEWKYWKVLRLEKNWMKK